MTPSDLDTLADYVEGLLDGTPEADAVAERIAADPTWADAYRQLTAATPQVTAELAELAHPPLPPAIAARLESAMEKQYATSQTIVRLKPRRSPARSEGWTRFGGWAAAAVIVLVICVGGIAAIRSGSSSNNDSASSSKASGVSAPAGTVAAGGVHKSGLYYRSADLGPQARNQLEPGTTAGTMSQAVPAPAAAPSGPLSRLAGASALRTCLVTLGVSEAQSVDYATLDGQPAVVIVTPDPSGRTWDVLAVGPECGVNGQPHLLQRTTVPR
jgi:hypothetical protein